MSRHAWIALFIVAALAAGYLTGLRSDVATDNALQKSTGIAPAKARSASLLSLVNPPPVSPRKLATSSAPLPPANTPVKAIYDDLSRRAGAGDATAAMRLFGDLNRCKNRKTLSTSLNFTTADDMPGDKDGMTRSLLDKLDATDALCADVDEAWIDGRGEWLRDAAVAGDAEAMVCYALSPNDFGPAFMSDGWFDWAERWRDEAPQFAAQAFAAGQADAIQLLLDGATDNRLPDGTREVSFQFGGLVTPDPEAAYIYARLYAAVAPGTDLARANHRVASTRQALSADQVAQADMLVDEQAPRFAAQAGDRRNVFPCAGTFRSMRPW